MIYISHDESHNIFTIKLSFHSALSSIIKGKDYNRKKKGLNLMKLKGKIDMMAFLKELKKCTGEVFFAVSYTHLTLPTIA